jgi:hypothetical protein
VTIKEFLRTKNTYYSGVAGAMGGLIGGKAWQSGLISATIATLDVACFPHERPPHISSSKWFLGNLLSSTATGLVAFGLGHGVRNFVKEENKPASFAERELAKRESTEPDFIRQLTRAAF